ncbi:MAG: type II CAAX endopeptidase family protein [Chitinophagaceae bacterium]
MEEFEDASVCEEEVDDQQHYKWLRVLSLFYGIDLLVCTGINFISYFHGIGWLLFTEVFLGTLTIVFIIFLWKDVKSLFTWRTYTLQKALVYAIAAVLFAVLVNTGVKWINQNIFHQEIYYYRSFRHLAYPKLAMILLVAILPALFEELAYRGIILQSLFNITEERQAIFMSAFLFAIIHMSFVSFLWLMPFAIWLGNIRLKENTIWYGVLIHFCFNVTACLYEFYELSVF